MTTAKATAGSTPRAPRDALAERYGRIGISAVAAAASYAEAPKPQSNADNRRWPAAAD